MDDTLEFTDQEVALMVALVAKLIDPDRQSDELTKSVIYKARFALAEGKRRGL